MFTRWSNASLLNPLDLRIADDFDDDFSPTDYVSGLSPIEQTQKEWDDAVADRTFFTIPATKVTNPNYSNINQYNDSEMGIYKSYDWFTNVSSSALAVTQYFGIVRNPGSSNEYLEMTHADIIVNYRDFTFSMNENSAVHYDLPTVILHELGHFLGLDHVYDFAAYSIMQPYLSTFESLRTVQTYDENLINDQYNDAQISSLNGASGVTLPSPYNEGDIVHGIIELRSSGECIHYQNDQVIQKHLVNLK